MGWFVLETIVPHLTFTHVGMNCDNSGTVSWTNKYRTSSSLAAARMLRILCLRLHKRRAAPGLVTGISGDDNTLADDASRSFNKESAHYIPPHQLTSLFNSRFPLPQNHSWKEWTLAPELVSKVMQCLLGDSSKVGQLLRLKKIDKSTGPIGRNTATTGTAAPFSKTSHKLKQISSSLPLLSGSGRVITVEEINSKFNQLVKRSRPSPRPSSWLDNKAQSTGLTKSTKNPLRNSSKQ